MIYTFLISIVFIAEIIIAIAIIQSLHRLDKTVLEFDATVQAAKSGVEDIANLSKNISYQLVELAEQFVEKFKQNQEDIFLKHLSKILMALLLLKINSKTINKFRKTKVAKVLGRGLSLLENMV